MGNSLCMCVHHPDDITPAEEAYRTLFSTLARLSFAIRAGNCLRSNYEHLSNNNRHWNPEQIAYHASLMRDIKQLLEQQCAERNQAERECRDLKREIDATRTYEERQQRWRVHNQRAWWREPRGEGRVRGDNTKRGGEGVGRQALDGTVGEMTQGGSTFSADGWTSQTDRQNEQDSSWDENTSVGDWEAISEDGTNSSWDAVIFAHDDWLSRTRTAIQDWTRLGTINLSELAATANQK